ncbi:cation:proton antiporter domain-containing protein [Nonomuraea muscovyensis]|uniref:NhaP-type Na+/H+ or K+/H+ antiporter n=1 Tax=Nonomuraea muscovyensis TaxID=1124761 RepID=A0A7X0C716_9ACTN|nr:cation:proton antiporter [Nonomuraea muscovyensis]MBB6349723.1 NhaP-type Na+/H+ or K+/H+ antiporter [Nonomuraea muscovyensis]
MPFGAAPSFMPTTDQINLPSDVVLGVFLPPLLRHAAFLSAPRESRQDAGPILALAVGLTWVTAVSVMATLSLAVPGLPWAAALALGVAVARPTDAVSATSVPQRVGDPRRLVTILEGESLVNDGAALTLVAVAVAVVAGEMPVADGVVDLLRIVCCGILHGLVVAWPRS